MKELVLMVEGGSSSLEYIQGLSLQMKYNKEFTYLKMEELL